MKYVKVQCDECLFHLWELEENLKHLHQCLACQSPTKVINPPPKTYTPYIFTSKAIGCPNCSYQLTNENFSQFYKDRSCPNCGYGGSAFVYVYRTKLMACVQCGCEPAAEGYTQDPLAKDLATCPKCGYSNLASDNAGNGEFFFNHSYTGGERVLCERCQAPTYVQIVGAGAVSVTTGGGVRNATMICGDCGRKLCKTCAIEVGFPPGMNMGLIHCDECGGIIAMPSRR